MPRADAPPGTSRLQVAVPVGVDAARATQVLGNARPAWLGERQETGGTDVDHFLVDLELRVTDHAPRVAFRKAAHVEVGPVASEAGTDRVSLEISWRAAAMAPLFPVFAGTLTWDAGELRLDGYYAPPGGGVGMVADRLVMNAAARATARRLLERIASVMEESPAD